MRWVALPLAVTTCVGICVTWLSVTLLPRASVRVAVVTWSVLVCALVCLIDRRGRAYQVVAGSQAYRRFQVVKKVVLGLLGAVALSVIGEVIARWLFGYGQ